jgi:hypothetical protein
LDDNLRYNTKDYRNQIYLGIPKEMALKDAPKSPSAKTFITKYKSLTKNEEKLPPAKANNFKVVKHKSTSHSSNIRHKGITVI